MEGAEDAPDGFVPAFFGKDFIQKDEAFVVDAFFGGGSGGELLDCALDLVEVVAGEGFVEAFFLKG